ncbi:hypothetical protein [Flavobacterium chuncheonense]|uniref:hypothetical protein n=1 Tax=Flavobacterium chuncheonense TaxID=2026653 RepID=UPI0036D2B8DB
MNKTEKFTFLILGTIYLLIIIFTILVNLKKIVIQKVSFGKVLKINLFISLLVLVFLFILNYINFIDYEKPIPYKEVNQITFKKFKGFEFFKKELYGSKYFAYVFTSIDYEITKESINIDAHFHPSRSFVYDKEAKSSELLNHEIYHFKITEIFARKIRKEIIQKKAFDKKLIEEIISKNIILENRFQEKYDYDTFHSYVLKEQKKYEKIVDSTLKSLNKYEDSKIKFYDK